MSRHSIARCIHEARLARGMTQQVVAAELGVTQQLILRYERGLVNVPSERLEQLAVIFRIDPREFFNDTPPMATKETPTHA